jgi:hypothetical protein
MRRCRHCQEWFEPEKLYYWYCSWDCRVADVGSDYQRDYRGHQRARDNTYDRGFWDGMRSGPMNSTIPPGIWKGLLLFCHPDKWQGEPGLVTLATEVTRWLLEHRPR